MLKHLWRAPEKSKHSFQGKSMWTNFIVCKRCSDHQASHKRIDSYLILVRRKFAAIFLSPFYKPRPALRTTSDPVIISVISQRKKEIRLRLKVLFNVRVFFFLFFFFFCFVAVLQWSIFYFYIVMPGGCAVQNKENWTNISPRMSSLSIFYVLSRQQICPNYLPWYRDAPWKFYTLHSNYKQFLYSIFCFLFL